MTLISLLHYSSAQASYSPKSDAIPPTATFLGSKVTLVEGASPVSGFPSVLSAPAGPKPRKIRQSVNGETRNLITKNATY